MSKTGLPVFDKTLQTTHIWLDEIMAELGPDRRFAWRVLSVVLHTLRDRLPLELAAHLGAQLPLLVRGAYYDQFQPRRLPTGLSTFEDFADEVGEWLSDTRPVDPRDAALTVFAVLSRFLDPGQVEKVRDALPRDVREAWEEVEAAGPRPPWWAEQRQAPPS